MGDFDMQGIYDVAASITAVTVLLHTNVCSILWYSEIRILYIYACITDCTETFLYRMIMDYSWHVYIKRETWW